MSHHSTQKVVGILSDLVQLVNLYIRLMALAPANRYKGARGGHDNLSRCWSDLNVLGFVLP